MSAKLKYILSYFEQIICSACRLYHIYIVYTVNTEGVNSIHDDSMGFGFVCVNVVRKRGKRVQKCDMYVVK